MTKQTHVTPHPSGWAAKDTGNDKASRVFETKLETVNWARQHSQREQSELVIHNLNGRIGAKDSHGNDPYPPKG